MSKKDNSTFFVGIDLAWSRRNATGIAILKGRKDRAELVCSTVDILSDNRIVDYIITHTGNAPAIIAVDASLVVSNMTGERKAETELKKIFATYHAVPYPSNRNLCNRLYGGIRGEDIARALIKNGFQHNPYIKQYTNERTFFETYPHSAMVVLFNLKQVLKYKARKDRSYDYRWQEFQRYQAFMKGLEFNKPALRVPDELLNTDVTALKGKALKQYEDLLDAVFCAYIAYYYWSAPETCSVIGSLEDGYIITPVFNLG